MSLTSRQVLLRCIPVITSVLLLTACQPKSSTPTQQNILSQDGAFAATVSHSGKYALVSSLYHGVSAWDMEQSGALYNWYQTPKGQDFSLFNDGDSNASADNNFVSFTAISYDDSSALLADEHSFTRWDLATGENTGYWTIKPSKVVYRTKKVGGELITTELFDVIEKHNCTNPDTSKSETCAFTADIRAIDISNQGKHILLGKSDGTLVHIRLSDGRRIEFLGHQQEIIDGDSGETYHLNNAINSASLSPNGLYALSGSSDQSAYLWDTKTGQVLYKFQHDARVVMVQLDPKARYAFTADSKNTAVIWDLKTGKKVSQLAIQGRQQIFTTAQFSDNGRWLVTGSPNQKLTLWSVASGNKQQEWLVTPRKNSRPSSAVVYSASFINQDTQILTASSAGLSEVWDIKP